MKEQLEKQVKELQTEHKLLTDHLKRVGERIEALKNEKLK